MKVFRAVDPALDRSLNMLRQPSASILCALAIAPAAIATDLSNNIPNATIGAEAATPTRSLAAGFATDAAAHTLSSVTLRLGNSQTGDATLALYSNAGLEPGSQLAVLSSPSTFPGEPGPVTFTAAGTISLSASTSYWLVLRPSVGQFEWTFSDNSNGTGPGWQGQWGVNDVSAPTLWWTQDSYPLQMRVVVDACGSADFDNDGDSGTDADIEAFFACLAGSCCARCGSADFNADGDTGTDADIEAFFRVLGGGSC
jgi:hypothetical protein